MLKVQICVPLGPGQPGLYVFKFLSSLESFRGYTEQRPRAELGAGQEVMPEAVRTLVPLAGVAGEDGMDVQLWLLWLALELERVGEAAREDGLDLRPRDRKGVMPCDAPSGRMNFSLSSMLVLPRARKGNKYTHIQWQLTLKKYIFDGHTAAWPHENSYIIYRFSTICGFF